MNLLVVWGLRGARLRSPHHLRQMYSCHPRLLVRMAERTGAAPRGSHRPPPAEQSRRCALVEDIEETGKRKKGHIAVP